MLQNVIDRKPYPDDENLVEVKFARTPIMSTYLVAFVVGEYDFVETRSLDGVLVRVYTPVGKAEQGKFALEVNVPRVIPSLLSRPPTGCSCLCPLLGHVNVHRASGGVFASVAPGDRPRW